MGDCKCCNNNRYIVYYGNVGVCADCSDDLSISDIFEMQTNESQKLKEENKLLREFVNLVDIYEGEIIDGKRFEAESIIELGELARKTLKEIDKDIVTND